LGTVGFSGLAGFCLAIFDPHAQKISARIVSTLLAHSNHPFGLEIYERLPLNNRQKCHFYSFPAHNSRNRRSISFCGTRLPLTLTNGLLGTTAGPARRFYRPGSTIGRRSRCRDHRRILIGPKILLRVRCSFSACRGLPKVRADRNTAAPLIITQALELREARVIRGLCKVIRYRRYRGRGAK